MEGALEREVEADGRNYVVTLTPTLNLTLTHLCSTARIPPQRSQQSSDSARLHCTTACARQVGSGVTIAIPMT
jgi:hypothetical protein